MEPVGTLSEGLSKFMNKIYIYSCVRKPGFVYEFSCRKGRLYQCCGCLRFGKTRCITIDKDSLVAAEVHPEDGHHAECKPISEAGAYTHI